MRPDLRSYRLWGYHQIKLAEALGMSESTQKACGMRKWKGLRWNVWKTHNLGGWQQERSQLRNRTGHRGVTRTSWKIDSTDGPYYRIWKDCIGGPGGGPFEKLKKEIKNINSPIPDW